MPTSCACNDSAQAADGCSSTSDARISASSNRTVLVRICTPNGHAGSLASRAIADLAPPDRVPHPPSFSADELVALLAPVLVRQGVSLAGTEVREAASPPAAPPGCRRLPFAGRGSHWPSRCCSTSPANGGRCRAGPRWCSPTTASSLMAPTVDLVARQPRASGRSAQSAEIDRPVGPGGHQHGRFADCLVGRVRGRLIAGRSPLRPEARVAVDPSRDLVFTGNPGLPPRPPSPAWCPRPNWRRSECWLPGRSTIRSALIFVEALHRPDRPSVAAPWQRAPSGALFIDESCPDAHQRQRLRSRRRRHLPGRLPRCGDVVVIAAMWASTGWDNSSTPSSDARPIAHAPWSSTTRRIPRTEVPSGAAFAAWLDAQWLQVDHDVHQLLTPQGTP